MFTIPEAHPSQHSAYHGGLAARPPYCGAVDCGRDRDLQHLQIA